MDWLQNNWIWFAVVAGLIAMHFSVIAATVTGVPAMAEVTRSRTPLARVALRLRRMGLRPISFMNWHQRPLFPFQCQDFRRAGKPTV